MSAPTWAMVAAARKEGISLDLDTCPECRQPGTHEATADDGTVLWRCLWCKRQGIGPNDVPYEYPMIFDRDGRKYV